MGWPGRKGEEGGGSEDPEDILLADLSFYVTFNFNNGLSANSKYLGEKGLLN